ncbi:class I adenylate-forming enzyme family protein [Pseudomonas sp. BF-R-01]|jgi:fatty-acyl-CoA synthase|uniref:class I adenylate-forming enzyme family protein n=1 Tax=Pseudomonas sp. BF-R-01 TaxID=2832365 RepID=UPI001CBC03F4|nr:AMP-binding protein [Pseudomonas sp. BF-R-01]
MAQRTSHFIAETDVDFLPWSIGDLLRDAAHRRPDHTALIVPADAQGRPEQRWTYRELEAEAERVATALLRHCDTGDRVATWAGASSNLLMLHLGAALAGVVLVTLNPACRGEELKYLLGQGDVRGIFLDRVFRNMDNIAVLEAVRPTLPKLDSVVYLDEWQAFIGGACDASKLPSVNPDAPALIIFTSGTTGKPKGAMLGHAGVVNNARYAQARIGMPEGAVWLNMLPMFHVGGSVTMTLGCIANLGTQVLLPEFNPEAMLDALQRYQVNMTMAVPTMILAAIQSEQFDHTDLSHLQVLVTGGTVVVPDLIRIVRERFRCEPMIVFGQTEAGGSMCLSRRGDDVELLTQSVGAPLPLSEVKIIDIDGCLAPIGQVGEICVKTRCRMLEYFRMPEKTSQTIDDDGWVHTGDLGSLQPDGYVQITGRLKDMIIRGGENIYPREIEDLLAEHPAVQQSAVFGVPDEKWGEQVAVAIVLKSGYSCNAEELGLFLDGQIARHKMPRVWRFLDTLPVTPTGKVQKFVLREQLLRE